MEIDIKLLATLIRDSYKLFCLESEGVKDWNKYKSALSSDNGTLSYSDYANKKDVEVVALFLENMQAAKHK